MCLEVCVCVSVTDQLTVEQRNDLIGNPARSAKKLLQVGCRQMTGKNVNSAFWLKATELCGDYMGYMIPTYIHLPIMKWILQVPA